MSIASGGSTAATFKYDFDGRRVQQQITSTTATHSLWDVTTRYGDVLLETAYSGSTPNAKASYVYANGAVAELLSQKKNGASNPEYFLLDGQGSVRGLTNISGALVTGSEFSYDTFGKPVGSTDLTKSSYLYTGQQYDSVSQLYDLRARYYSPQQGRFLSQDTWPVDYQNPAELNRYDYTANNPVNGSDPSGNNTAAGTSSIISTISLGLLVTGAAGVGILGLVGTHVLDYIAAFLGITLILNARQMWDLAQTSLSQIDRRNRPRFAIAYGVAFVKGELKIFLTVSNFWGSNGVSNQEVFETPALELRNLVYRFKGGVYVEGADKNSNQHAEQLMISLLNENIGDLDAGQFIPVGVSKFDICATCWGMGVSVSFPAGFAFEVNIAKGIRVRFYGGEQGGPRT